MNRTTIIFALLPLLSGCPFVSEGVPEADCTSSSTGDPTTIDWPPTTSTTSQATSDSDTPTESSGVETTDAEEDTETTSSAGSDSTGQPALTSESSSGEESSTGEPAYDAHHCGPDCEDEDEITFDFAGNPTCYCALPCTLESDCDADQACNAVLDRCVISCANGPGTCPEGTVCGLVDETPPYAQMCLWWLEDGE